MVSLSSLLVPSWSFASYALLSLPLQLGAAGGLLLLPYRTVLSALSSLSIFRCEYIIFFASFLLKCAKEWTRLVCCLSASKKGILCSNAL